MLIFRTDLQSFSVADPYVWSINDLIKNEMVFGDTCIFLLNADINRLAQARQHCSDLMGIS